MFKQIGEVSDETGINPKTIRYYEEIGLIPEPQRNNINYRLYDESDVNRLSFIHRARQLDFSLDGIREILALREKGEVPCLFVTRLVDKRLVEIDAKITALERLRFELEEIQDLAQSLSREEIHLNDCVCHLIENQSLIHPKKQ